MTDNITVKDATGVSRTVATTESGGVHTPHHIVDSAVLPTGAATAARQAAPGSAGTPSGDVTSVQGVSGGTAVPVTDAPVAALITALGHAEDAMSADGDTGVMLLGVRQAFPGTVTSLDGDYEALKIGAGRLHVSGANPSLEDLVVILINDVRALQGMFLKAFGDDSDQQAWRDIQDPP